MRKPANNRQFFWRQWQMVGQLQMHNLSGDFVWAEFFILFHVLVASFFLKPGLVAFFPKRTLRKQYCDGGFSCMNIRGKEVFQPRLASSHRSFPWLNSSRLNGIHQSGLAMLTCAKSCQAANAPALPVV